MAPAISKRWVFTINNYSEDEYANLESAFDSFAIVKYLVFGREVGEAQATPHLQGFVILSRNQRRSWLLTNLCRRGYWQPALASSQAASDYCKKDGDFKEFGHLPVEQGRRTDIEAFLEWGQDFIRAHSRAPTSPEIAVERPREYLRYPRAVNLFARQAPPPSLRQGEPRPWQQDLEALLEVDADDRVIRFYVDADGGKGKTWFQQYYFTKYPDKVQILGVGRREDLTYALDVSKSIFFFNVPRDGMQFLQYTVLEQLKDRMVFSTKYQSCLKLYRTNVHVCVFSNEFPDESKMSADRFVIRELTINDI